MGDAFGRASGQVGFDIVAAEIGGRAIPGRFQPPETIFNGVVPTATFTPTPRSWSLPVIQPTCFIAGTLIWTESGLRPIEDIKPGDKVLSFNETTHQTSYQAVEQTFVRVAGVILPITIGDDPIPIRTTLHHPFFVYRPRSNLTADVELPSDTDGQWIEAGELQVGDKVRRPNGQWVTVTTIGPLEPSETVYNFEVSKTHTYFVSANGVLVHNPPPNTYINWKGDTVTVPQGHILSPRDPLFSDPPIFQAGPFTTAQKDAFLKGKSGGTKLSPHHRHQVPTTHGSVIDELPGPGHSSGNIHTGGSPSRHPGPSVFYEMERNGQKGEALRKSEIKAHWQAKGSRLVEVSPGVWIDPGPK